MTEEKKGLVPHNCILEDRKTLSVSGVNDVGSFDALEEIYEKDEREKNAQKA